jgi:type 1 fimbria pilin
MKVLDIMKMNKIIGLSLLAASVTTSFQAAAALTTDLTITGEIANGACSIDVGGGNGNVNLGDLANNSLGANGTTITPVVMPLTLDCSAPVFVAFRTMDNRSDTVNTSNFNAIPTNARYGMGNDASGNPIGFYAYNIWYRSHNGGAGGTVLSAPLPDGSSWASLGTGITPPVGNYFTVGNTGSSTPVPLTHLEFELNVKPLIAPVAELNTTQEIVIDGSTTFEVVYL